MRDKLLSKREGFTMIETLITLAIVSSLLILVMVGRSQFTKQSPRQETAFWHDFDAQWQRALYEARYQKLVTTVQIQSGQPVQFDSRRTHQLVELPASLQPMRDYHLRIREDATISPQTLTFISSIDDCRYRMIIQMGWGLYRIEKVSK